MPEPHVLKALDLFERHIDGLLTETDVVRELPQHWTVNEASRDWQDIAFALARLVIAEREGSRK